MSLVVPTGSGPVAGRLAGDVRSWPGIPYASADRFGPAGPAPSWSEPRSATTPGPVGVQWTPAGTLTGTEECLTLDVYAPVDVPGPLPVLFWVHGGAFQTGAAADYDGSVLAAAAPAVVVAVSYRLGPFGFLQLGTAAAPEPSPAITDLLAALAWVDREIAAFGGDPDRITLVGQSAGASLVCALLATPAGQRARAAVAFSVGGPVLEPAETEDVAARTLHQLGLPRTDLAALRALPAEAVMTAAATVSRESRRQRLGGVVWGPVLDGAVLPAQPADAVAAGALRDTSLWFGSCRDEMTMFLQHGSDDAVTVARARVGGARFDRLREVYAATARPEEDPVQALLTDEMWVQPAWELALATSAAGGRAWLSRWDHAPDLPPYDRLGPTHGADNACLWAHPPFFVERPLLARPAGDMTDADLAVTAALHDAVLGMVQAGTPATGALADWVPYEPTARCTAVFDAVPRVESDPAAQRRRAWAALSGG
ncbi:Carboxylesterase [Modestobacter italicus]|uniref:Carboxylic ester hydrolase n=1 Tax=Modestobacter italicus (strain DSM 44449 / CECT 9708 / BC 501) TaxID=2732864 RepID=I4EYB4_MODI5|nr:carboxylesterase family protein [Modestobacter marinus]CCH88377.1 Carboxylesterase [Modestobacter marinus]